MASPWPMSRNATLSRFCACAKPAPITTTKISGRKNGFLFMLYFKHYTPLNFVLVMEYFTAKTFQIPKLKGISEKNIEEHLKLYAGYVKFANYIQNQIVELGKDSEKWAYELGELQRRFAFEYDGMRNHEIYFSSLEGGSTPLSIDGALMKAIQKEWGTYYAFLSRMKAVAMTRGIGWAMLYQDMTSGHMLMQWVDEQHLGHLQGLKPILALDIWEHSYVADYQPSGKKQYVEDFFANLNWSVVEKRFE